MHYLDVNNYLNKVTEYYKDIASKKNSTLEELSKQTKELKVFMTEIKDPLSSNKKIFTYIVNNIANEENLLFTKMEQLLLSGEFPPNLHLFYDDYICNKLDLNKILRLMAIESLTQGGVQDYNNIKRDILNIYGYQNIFLFRDLEELGWLKGKTYIKNLIEMSYSQLFEKLELVNASPNEKKVENCSYILSGFCPISLRLIEKAVEGKWNKIQDIIKKMPGECSFPIDETEISKPTKEVNTIFVVFVGGVTYSEIEGIRFLNRKFKEAYDKNKNKKATRTQLIIITTGILSTKKIFSSLGKKIISTYSMKKFHEQVKKK
jgi:lysine-specific histone demethylase 1